MEAVRIGKRSQTYLLDFCSVELISSVNTRISKSFTGKISNTVKTLFKDDKYLASDKTLVVDETKNDASFISPYWSPLKTINWCSERAMNKRGVANYLFYETNKTFEFCSIDTLVNTDAIRKYTLSDIDSRTQAPDDFGIQYTNVESVNTDVAFDYIKNLSSGMYGSSLYTYDLTTKSIDTTKYDYIKDFAKTNHLDKYPLHTPDLLKKLQSSTHHIVKNNYLNGNKRPMMFNESFQQRNSLMAQINSFKFDISVFGRTDTKIGDVIEFEMPELREITADQIESTKSSTFSGRYLITAIRHSILQGNHKMSMEITSDSFAKALQ